MKWLKQAHIKVIVVSWWGRWKQGEFERNTIPKILEVAAEHGIKVAWHIEPYKRRSAKSVGRDIQFIIKEYGGYPAFYRDPNYGNRPVFYVYKVKDKIPKSDWGVMLKDLKDGGINTIVLAQTLDRDIVVAGGFDGFYSYDVLKPRMEDWVKHAKWARDNEKIFAPSVGPGYIDRRAKPTSKRAERDRGLGGDDEGRGGG